MQYPSLALRQRFSSLPDHHSTSVICLCFGYALPLFIQFGRRTVLGLRLRLRLRLRRRWRLRFGRRCSPGPGYKSDQAPVQPAFLLCCVAVGSGGLRGFIADGRGWCGRRPVGAANLVRGPRRMTWPKMSRKARRWHKLHGFVTWQATLSRARYSEKLRNGPALAHPSGLAPRSLSHPASFTTLGCIEGP